MSVITVTVPKGTIVEVVEVEEDTLNTTPSADEPGAEAALSAEAAAEAAAGATTDVTDSGVAETPPVEDQPPPAANAETPANPPEEPAT